MQIYLAVTPGEVKEAGRYGKSLAHVAYRIGPGSVLLRQNLLLQTRGGLLSVSDREIPTIEDPHALCAAVARECGRRSYQGVLLDFEEPPRADRLAFVSQLEKTLGDARRSLYVPESYAAAAPKAFVLVCTAISGGSFTEYLQSALARFRTRTVLDVQRLQMDFLLPCRSGEGTPLQRQALVSLMEQENPSTFFSPDLAARYFTYTQNGETHFVLFDDASTLLHKLRIASRLGYSTAFFMWPEIRDLAGNLFGS